MKYIIIPLGYILIGILITLLVLVERIIKLLIILSKIIWFLKFNKKWLKILDEYLIIFIPSVIAIPLLFYFGIGWRVKTLKDVYLLRNYTRII